MDPAAQMMADYEAKCNEPLVCRMCEYNLVLYRQGLARQREQHHMYMQALAEMHTINADLERRTKLYFDRNTQFSHDLVRLRQDNDWLRNQNHELALLLETALAKK